MIGIIVPAHNEHVLLNSCLASLTKAALHPDLKGAGGVAYGRTLHVYGSLLRDRRPSPYYPAYRPPL
jgi:hypothetical protein